MSRIWRSDWLPKILSRVYDPRNVPVSEKRGVTIGMAMTEKQGGSDVRANTTRALSRGGRRAGRTLRTRRPQVLRLGADVRRLPDAGASPGRPLLLPRPALAPDGTKNPLQIVRLKRKMGNVSNASSETELRGALRLSWSAPRGGASRPSSRWWR